MRSKLSGAEAPKANSISRRIAAATLVGGMGLGLAGCGGSGSPAGSALKSCQNGWETLTSQTDDPSQANTSMQEGIAKLINAVDATGAKDENGYKVDKIPQNLVGAAMGVLKHFPESIYLQRYSALQDYSNEVCVDEITGETYLTPAYLSAVGSLAAAGIEVQTGALRNGDFPTHKGND